MDGLKDRLHLFDSGPCFIFRFGGRSLASKIRPRHLRHFLKRSLKVAGRRKISDNDFTEFFLVIGEGGKAELPHEVAFKSGAGGISGLQRTHFFGEFIVSGLDLLRGTCEFSEIVFPVFGAGHFPIVCRLISRGFGTDFCGRLVGWLILHFFEERVFQQLALDRFHKLQAG